MDKRFAISATFYILTFYNFDEVRHNCIAFADLSGLNNELKYIDEANKRREGLNKTRLYGDINVKSEYFYFESDSKEELENARPIRLTYWNAAGRQSEYYFLNPTLVASTIKWAFGSDPDECFAEKASRADLVSPLLTVETLEFIGSSEIITKEITTCSLDELLTTKE